MMRLPGYVIAISLAIIVCVSAARADEKPRPDPTCSEVNKAYSQSNRPAQYSITTYQVKDDGSLKPYQALRVVDDNYYTKYSLSDTWLLHGKPYFSIMDRMGPKFTSCKLLGKKGKLLHYSATWHKFPYTAATELWVAKDNRRLMKMLRRYPDSLWELPFAVALEIYDYNATNVGASAPSAGERPRPDPSCLDVNNAYRQRNRPPHYSTMTYQVKDDGSLKPFYAFRVVKDNSYTKYSFSDKWLAHGQPYFSIMDRMGPKFTSCKLMGEDSSVLGKLLHYSATWHSFPYTAAAELWVTQHNHRLMKLVRHYPDTGWEFPFPVAVDLYDYNPAQTLPAAPEPTTLVSTP
ncbi:hypothetical protein NKI95_17005 [Mesorhizobium sp. M0306]|uniref:hypothetical protein n=1 Tax=Mesorhizobium sp. M0306 TaxID=2956932 RepID=UPI00333CC856